MKAFLYRSLRDLADALRDFARARDWEQFHAPKNLAMALAGEVGELAACFQWLTPEESRRVKDEPATAADVESEVADVPQASSGWPASSAARDGPPP